MKPLSHLKCFFLIQNVGNGLDGHMLLLLGSFVILLLKGIHGLESWAPNVRKGYLGVICFLF